MMEDVSTALSSVMGNAVAVALLLSDWEKYGLEERVAYHFHLTEALADSEVERNDPNQSNQQAYIPRDPVCGVASLMECVPTQQWHRLTRRQKRALKHEIGLFNARAAEARQDEEVYCYEPPTLPLRLTPMSRVSFCYETTRMAFVLDASPTLTSAHGSDDAHGTCPLDRLPHMVQTFFHSLVEAIPVPSTTGKCLFRPELAVTVLAVFPNSDVDDNDETPMINLLVRDYRLVDDRSAEILSKKLQEWALGEVEDEIARRLSRRRPSTSRRSPWMVYEEGTLPQHASLLSDLLEAGDAALSILSSAARPCIVVATDGRSVAGDDIMDVVADPNRIDVPVIVLDLSNPASHMDVTTKQKADETSGSYHLLSYDPNGAIFPLHFSDDAESLYDVCKVTDGCFFDAQLLHECAENYAGHVASESLLIQDHFFSFKRHAMRPNGIQWYTLFSVSQLTPTHHSVWGKLPPPEYIRQKLATSTQADNVPREYVGNLGVSGLATNRTLNMMRQNSSTSDGFRSYPLRGESMDSGVTARGPQARTTFSTYIINPIRIQGLLLMRVKEGYRAKQYGQSTNDPDKVCILFTLPLELGLVLQYELSYKALPGQTHMVGFAHIKIEVLGDTGLVQMVKNDFLRQGSRSRPSTVAQQMSARLCQLLKSTRQEDMFQSYLSPLKWSDQLSSPHTPFVRRLLSLTRRASQRHHHSRRDEFDCVCVGRMPYVDDGFLEDFVDGDDGEQELLNAVAAFSSQSIEEGKFYVCRVHTREAGPPCYCVIELRRAPSASRVFTIILESFIGQRASDRLALLASIRERIGKLHAVELLPKQMGRYVVGVRGASSVTSADRKQKLLEHQHNHERWDLVKDPELLPLLMKRRTEIGEFLLLDSSDDHALFAKLIPEHDRTTYDITRDPGNLVQYQFVVHSDRVVVDLHMESESGLFFPGKRPLFLQDQPVSKFDRLATILKRRDQECGKALKCRTNLNHLLDSEIPCTPELEESHRSCVLRLLEYASPSSLQLRFFHSNSGVANDVLMSLTEDMILSQAFGPKVAKLAIKSGDISLASRGEWFLIGHDQHTMSFMLFSTEDIACVDSDGRGCTTHEMSFYTFSIGDLYSKRDDVADDSSDVDHISEHLCVTEFTDLISSAHIENYAAAAYISLRSESLPDQCRFHLDDFAFVMVRIEFVEAAKVLVAAEDTVEAAKVSNLEKLIRTVLHPIGGDCYSLYFESTEREDIFMNYGDDDSDTLSLFGVASAGGTDGDASEDGTRLSDVHATEEVEAVEVESLDDKRFQQTPRSLLAPAPIFVRLLLDGIPASLYDLSKIKHSTNLSVLVSVFAERENWAQPEPRLLEPANLPASHVNATLELTSLLNAYAAEQTLERLRHLGSSLGDSNLRIARSCLRKARNVASLTIDIFFYVAKRDMLVPASVPADENEAIDDAFAMLSTELQRSSNFSMKMFTQDNFIAIAGDNGPLEFWGFLSIRKSRGHVCVEIYHPAGADAGSSILSTMHQLISESCHRVNQILLLRHLHKSRNASVLLVPPDSGGRNVDDAEVSTGLPDEGSFGCPVVHRAKFDLFYRCATNPGQVARTLEATVLHIFAVSNRRNLFVYKDEDGSIVYMTLRPIGGGADADGQIELLIHGVDKPNVAVTTELSKLLQKRLLSIAVEMLGSVLAKNPHYAWRSADLTFVKLFDSEWERLSDFDTSLSSAKEQEYSLPQTVTDPKMVMIHLRQNLSGSTFFYPLAMAAEACSKERNEETVSESAGSPFDFVLYFNAASLKLDPKFQSQSTLTSKGKEFSRASGTGLAIVKVSLVAEKSKESYPKVKDAGNLHSTSVNSHVAEELVDEVGNDAKNSKICVHITDTALKRESLHAWVKLTLDQAVLAWAIERFFEDEQVSCANRLLLSSSSGQRLTGDQETTGLNFDLPNLVSLMDQAYAMPHPAVQKVELVGPIRSSAVALVALDLLERVIFDSFRNAAIGRWDVDDEEHIFTVRLSRDATPRRVQLSWDASKQKAIVREFASKAAGLSGIEIRDTPVDCPEYVCLYRYPEWAQPNYVSPPKLFDKVNVDAGTNDLSMTPNLLEAFKRSRSSSFHRSFAFLLSVKRDERRLTAYNWSPHLLKKIKERIQDHDKAAISACTQSIDALERKSLRGMRSAANTLTLQNVLIAADTPRQNDVPPQEVSESATSIGKVDRIAVSSGPHRDARPIVIRRPKLIGKSMDGSAAHAVAASRARASTNIIKGRGVGGVPRVPKRSVADLKEADRSSNTSDANPLDESGSRGGDEEKPEIDRALVQMNRNFISRAGSRKGVAASCHSFHARLSRELTHSVWPVEHSTRTISPRIANLLLSQSMFAGSFAVEVLQMRCLEGSSVASMLGLALSGWVPDLQPVPGSRTHASHKTPADDSIYLMSRVRSLRNFKCFAVARLSAIQQSADSTTMALMCDGWLMAYPRQPKRRHGIFDCRAQCEKDSTALDVLSTNFMAHFRPERMAFDFVASLAEGILKSCSGEFQYEDALDLTTSLISRYTLRSQVKMLRSNYKAFESSITLSSYRNHYIDMFPSSVLFEWLVSNIDTCELLLVNLNALCFKHEIVVGGTRSICFLRHDRAEKGKMDLVILCRSQGEQLFDFMFRKDSNVAISLANNIAVECAGLALVELRNAATRLYRDKLWHRMTTLDRPQEKTILVELLEFCTLTNIYRDGRSTLNIPDLPAFSMSNDVVDWLAVCSSLATESAFSPSCSLDPGEDYAYQHLLYSKKEDVFIRLSIRAGRRQLLEIDLIERGDAAGDDLVRRTILQNVLNYLLHWMWADML